LNRWCGTFTTSASSPAPDGQAVHSDRTVDALFEHEIITQGCVKVADTVAAQVELTVA
jgi:hypothetical protein